MPAGQTNDNPVSLQVTTNATVKAVMVAAADPKAGWFKGGTMVAWGDNEYGETDVPPGLSNVVAVAAGETTVALKSATGSVELQSAPPVLSVLEVGELLRLAPRFVLASGYQWYRNGNAVSMATNAAFTLSAVTIGDAGSYQLLAVGPTNALLSPASELFVYDREVQGQGNIAIDSDVSTGVLDFRAVAAPGWKLDHWEGDLSGTAFREEVTLTIDQPSVVARAVFVPAGRVSVTASVDGQGVVLGAGSYDERTVVNLIAAPEVGWVFDHWEGDVLAGQTNDNPLVLEVTQDTTLTAVVVAAADPKAGWLKGTVVAWGDNSYGQTNIPSGLSNVLAVAAGYDYTVALKADGT